MKSKDTTNWESLLSTRQTRSTMKKFALGQYSTQAVTKAFAYTDQAGEFRKLVRNNGTAYSRRLARKALRYRGIIEPSTCK